jgi:TetR/AcrR family transcriptional regulator, fatty acid metabolism regulator protein
MRKLPSVVPPRPPPAVVPSNVPAPVAVRSPAQEEKRRRILEAAVRAFARKGYHACRVGEIASEAGVAYGLVYHYFTSKDEILETIFRETWTQMLSAIEAVEEDGVPAGEQLRKVAAIVLRTWKRDPDLVRVLVREVTRSQHIQREVEEIEQAYAALQRIVQRGQASGEFRGDLEPRLAALVVYGALEEILTSWVMGQLDDSDEEVDRAEKAVVTLVRDGLRVRPGD